MIEEEYENDADVNYSERFYDDGYADDWDSNDRYITPTKADNWASNERLNSPQRFDDYNSNDNFNPPASYRHDNYRDLYPIGRNEDDKYLEMEKPPETWACPPGRVKKGNKCISKFLESLQ